MGHPPTQAPAETSNWAALATSIRASEPVSRLLGYRAKRPGTVDRAGAVCATGRRMDAATKLYTLDVGTGITRSWRCSWRTRTRRLRAPAVLHLWAALLHAFQLAWASEGAARIWEGTTRRAQERPSAAAGASPRRPPSLIVLYRPLMRRSDVFSWAQASSMRTMPRRRGCQATIYLLLHRRTPPCRSTPT